MELMPALANRRARRAFAPDPVPNEMRQVLWEAVSVAPSHGNRQPVRLLVAESEQVRQGLVAALSEGNRGWAAAAPLLLAIAVDPDQAGSAGADERQLWSFTAGIALGNLMAQATELGLVAHPMAGFDPAAVRDLFGAPADVRVLVVVAIGYPGTPETLPEDLQRRESAPQRRLPIDHLLVVDRWEERHNLGPRDLESRR